MYHCSQCSLAVFVTGEEKIKACTCDAPIIADMEAVASGESSLQG